MIDHTEFRDLLVQISATERFVEPSLEDTVAAIPRVDELRGEPFRGTVLVRTDLDVPIADGRVADPSRLVASAPTLRHCLDRGWKVVMLGHLGRDPRESLAPVSEAMAEILGVPVTFLPEWLDEANHRLLDRVVEAVGDAPRASAFMLENTRRYRVEQALWSPGEGGVEGLVDPLYRLASDIRQRLTDTEVNEAIAASNLDVSSAVLPLAMEATAMGFFLAEEMKVHIPAARRADFAVMSGLKLDKLDDLEAMLAAGRLELALVAGSLAMALVKARARRDGRDFFLGLAETDPGAKAFVSPGRIEQADGILESCRARGVELVLPVDFVLEGGEVATEIPEGRAQMDVGPRTRELFAERVRRYIEGARGSGRKHAMFYNGVFGKFEDPRFEAGTRAFIPLLKEMTAAGIATYVGGGEGRLALARYGSLADVTHAFTSGGTVLKCLANRKIGYLLAMYLQNARSAVL